MLARNRLNQPDAPESGLDLLRKIGPTLNRGGK